MRTSESCTMYKFKSIFEPNGLSLRLSCGGVAKMMTAEEYFYSRPKLRAALLDSVSLCRKRSRSDSFRNDRSARREILHVSR